MKINTVPDNYVSPKLAFFHRLRMQFCKNPSISLSKEYITLLVFNVFHLIGKIFHLIGKIFTFENQYPIGNNIYHKSNNFPIENIENSIGFSNNPRGVIFPLLNLYVHTAAVMHETVSFKKS